MFSSCGIQGDEKYSRKRIFEKLFESMKPCMNTHGDYFEHLNKIKLELSLCLHIFLFKLQSFWPGLNTFGVRYISLSERLDVKL